jgi:CRP-like cAMP-binding protein
MICDLPADALEDFRQVGSAVIYRPRQVVFVEGGRSGGLYLICHGAVKLYQSDRFGRVHILEIAGPRAVLGELSFDDAGCLSVSAEAVMESQLCFLSRERLMPFLAKHPQSALRLIAALSADLAATRRKLRDLALKSAASRLAGLLVQLARSKGDEQHLQLVYSRQELAEMVGVSTETAIRLLGKLKQKRAISVDGREVAITDLDKLTKLASCGQID